jgi:hypothetical protein
LAEGEIDSQLGRAPGKRNAATPMAVIMDDGFLSHAIRAKRKT